LLKIRFRIRLFGESTWKQLLKNAMVERPVQGLAEKYECFPVFWLIFSLYEHETTMACDVRGSGRAGEELYLM